MAGSRKSQGDKKDDNTGASQVGKKIGYLVQEVDKYAAREKQERLIGRAETCLEGRRLDPSVPAPDLFPPRLNYPHSQWYFSQ